MFKKISAIAALVALMVSGVTPGYAAPNQNSQSQSWFYSQYNTDSSTYNNTTTWTFNVPAGATEVRASVVFELGADFVAANVGKAFDVDVVLKKPNGQVFTNGEESGYFRIGNRYPDLPYTILNTDGFIDGSRSMNTTRFGTQAESIPAGTWTAELVATLDGSPVTFSSTSSAATASLKSQTQYIKGLGIIPAIPSSLSSAEYTSATCVDPTLAAPGDKLVFSTDYTKPDATVEHSDWGITAYTLASNNYTQTSNDLSNHQYITWSDELESAGLSASRTYYSNATTGSSPFVEVSIYNETTSTEVSTNCAGTVPQIPQLTISSTWGGNISFLDEPGVYRWEYQVVDAADNTVVATRATAYKSWGTLENGRYSFSINGSYLVGHLYKVRVRATNNVASSEWSEYSQASGLVGPNAPDAPTLAISSATSAKVTINKVTGIDNTSYYKAVLYEVNDRANAVAQSSDWACSQSMTDATKVECTINADSLVAPNQYVAIAKVKNSAGIYSVESADSNTVTGITAGYTLSGAPLSGLTTSGKARLVGDNILGSLLNSSAQKVSTTPDGLGGVYLANRTSTTEIKVSKIGGASTAIDTSFGSSGYATVTVDANLARPNSAGKVSWFGDAANRKWIATVGSNNGQLFAEGTAATTAATATEIAVHAFCQSHFSDADAGGEMRVYSAPTSRPLAMISCNLWSQNGQETHAILVKINADGTLTELVQLTPQGANDFYAVYSSDVYEMPELANSVNIAATGSETAIAIAIVNATYTPGNYSVNPPVPSTMTAHSRVLWRVPANLGTPTSTALTYTTNQNLQVMNGPSTEPYLKLQPFNNGNKIYAMVLKSATGCVYQGVPPNVVQNCNVPGASPSSYKLHETNVASGSLNSDAAAKTLTGSMSTQTEFQAITPGAGNVLQTIVKSASSNCGMNGCVVTGGQIIPGALDVTTGATARGETVSYTIGGSPVGAIWTNTAGKLQWLFTKPSAAGHSLVEWQPVAISAAPVSVPTITGGALGLSLNAGGAKIEITGTNLNLVTKVLFGTKEAKFTKTATKLTVTVPAGTTAGPVSVTVTYTGGQAAVPAGNWTYMGATKRAQTLTPTGLGDPTHSGASEADRNFSVASSLQGYNVTVVSKSATVCTYVSGVIDFIGNGTCVLQATQAGDAVTLASTQTYEIYYESVVNASALYSTDAGKPTITLTGVGFGAVSKVMFGNVEVVPTKKTDTSITVKVPAAPSTGVDVDVALKYNNGTVIDTDLTFDYVGVTKLSQTVTLSAGFSLATYGDAARTLSASSATADVAATNLPGLPYVFSSTTAGVCAVTGDQLRFLGAGTCTVKVTQAGNAGVNAATPVTFNITVSLKAQTITVDESPRNITDAEGVNLEATNSNEEVLLEYASNDEAICTVDGVGFVTGLSAGTCTITISAPADTRYSAATDKLVTLTVTPGEDPLPDAADVIDEEPVSIANGGAGTFVSLSDPSLQVSWDKAAGKLTPRATGVYTGTIVAELRFTKNGVNYVCTTVFGSTSKLANPRKPAALPNNATAKQIAAYAKAMAAYKVAYNKTWGSKIYSSKNFCADTSKLKSATALNPFGSNFAVSTVKASKTAAEKNSEKAALNALKGFTGNVTITVKRWRAWPTTMKNKVGNAGTGKTIPATKNVNTLTLG